MFCSDISAPVYFIFSSEVPHLLYYSHIPTGIFSLLIGIFVFWKNRSLLSGLLLGLVSVFNIWLLLSLIVWTNSNSQIIMFFWSMFGVLNALISVLSLYFVYVFVDKKDISWKLRGLLLLLLLPLLFFLPTSRNLPMFDLPNCQAIEGNYYINYYYGLNFFVFIWILVYGIHKYIQEKTDFRRQILLLVVGIEFFLLSFFVSGFLASYLTEIGYPNAFEVEQYGLFGMTVFVFLLGMLIVKYKAFNIKLLAAQALVAAIIILIASQFAFIQNPINRILTGITLVIVSTFGWWLVRSVKEVDRQREELEVVNKELDRLDKAKNEFINIASHQLRTPITVIKGVVSMIQQGDMDKLPVESKKKFYDGAMIKCQKLEEIINDILNATSLTNNKFNVMDRAAEDVDIRDFFEKMIEGFKIETLGRGIDLTIGELDASVPVIQGQRKYLEEAFSNLITNAIKYTPSEKKTNDIRDTRAGAATIMIGSKRDGDNIIFSVKDNGIGIAAEEIPNLFKKFYRAKNATAMYTDGTGLGLFIIKEIVQGHGGDVWVESELGKGTTFFIKLPIKQVGKADVKKFIEAQANLKM